ncbi:MAG: hypothetical protein V4556_10310 [Bacteroidota bacterium]
MKFLLYISLLTVFLGACRNKKITIVEEKYIDSLISKYSQPIVYETENEIQFWKDRIDPKFPGISNELKYAGLVTKRFSLTGDIKDMQIADSVLKQININYNSRESSPFLALMHNAITQHRFVEADSFLQQAKRIGIKQYETQTGTFDVDFESGRYFQAEKALNKIIAGNDYGYYFRKAKLAHYKGDIDTSISAMKRAVDISRNNIALKQASLSNLADLYLHSGHLQKAYDLYKESINLSSADLHSIMGIGWIALVHDKNEVLAEKIFQFVSTKTKAPDALYKLMYVAESRKDTMAQKKYATEFRDRVSDPAYGNMYNKYLIELYTGILNEPAKAESIASNELHNRATPQTYAWYAWSLFSNNKKAEALTAYQNNISGKPLEGLELYWMGKLMQGENKMYTAKEYFKAANENKYDLGPAMQNDIEKNLEK